VIEILAVADCCALHFAGFIRTPVRRLRRPDPAIDEKNAGKKIVKNLVPEALCCEK
jgi:hypothetical protein